MRGKERVREVGDEERWGKECWGKAERWDKRR